MRTGRGWRLSALRAFPALGEGRFGARRDRAAAAPRERVGPAYHRKDGSPEASCPVPGRTDPGTGSGGACLSVLSVGGCGGSAPA
ncbi:hypothetical protein TPA0910_53440 [Streptomyces hygroscopicus subsp. sporocinereus]|uniref:Uncharacterized protein n=1 Tax=Streptomyces hygroscopicus TaxID=1912 RepID=A0ABQ3U5N7_STRHY|nr:hypothetical protein TPA0910_53440 [Streptomyces hygroscopicus]